MISVQLPIPGMCAMIDPLEPPNCSLFRIGQSHRDSKRDGQFGKA